jgi:hypothetical protein
VRRAPTWPLMLRRDLAAVACDMTISQFERAVADGSMPAPINVGGEERWGLRTIEAAISTLTGEDRGDWRSKQPGLNRAA